MVGGRTRRSVPLLVGATVATGLPVAGALFTVLMNSEYRLSLLPLWFALFLFLNYLNLRLQRRSQEEGPEAIKEQVAQLHSALRWQVQSRTFGARSRLIAAPLEELDLDITPRLGLVRDPRLAKPEPISERDTDIIAAFITSKRRLLIVGEPGAGKTTAAYALIEHLDDDG